MASSWNKPPQDKSDTGSDEGNGRRLDLEKRQTTDNHGATNNGIIEFTEIGSRRKTR